PSPAHNRVSRFTMNGDVASGEVVLLDLDNLSTATNHNGGALHFGSDGKLYIAVGDNANGSNSQSFVILFGKILRINSDGTIPTDNPFYNTTTGKYRSIWALGLRNPFTFATRTQSPSIFINDVGQNTWEEINVGGAGDNYGCHNCEGPSSDPPYIDPFYWYTHTSGACAITGGDFYAPPVQPYPASYLNKYFFADYCAGWIRYVDPSASGSPPPATDF